MKDLDYLWLLVVVVFGVAGGNLLSNWVTAKVVAYEIQQAAREAEGRLAEANERAAQQRQLRNEVDQAKREEQRQQMRNVRGSGKTGRDLKRTCDDWQRAVEQTDTATARSEATKHCGRYEQYLESGIWTPDR